MRTLAIKLTLAFLLVGALGAVLVALFVAQQTRSGFDQFLSDSFEGSLVTALESYYAENGSWSGANMLLMQVYRRQQRPAERTLPWLLVDERGAVILGGGRYAPGQQIEARFLRAARPLMVEGQVVGYLVQMPVATFAAERPSPEAVFLLNLNRGILLSAVVAIGLALLVGMLLARNIAGPIRALTRATTAVAQGDLGHQVVVRGQDEIAELSTSFNQMSADLAQASRQRRQMTADIAHELRTPLSIILGYTESLRDGVLPPDAETFAILHDEAEHLSRLVQDLRILSLADAGELSLNLEPVAPVELLENVAARYAHQAEQKGVRLAVAETAVLPDILVDPGRLEQVLSNLVGNALRYTPAGGHILLSATQLAADRLTLRVADTGQGIAAADLPRVFDRFYKADRARAQEGESGLGLAIARSLVQMHGGAIRAESSRGGGATFIIELPLDAKG